MGPTILCEAVTGFAGSLQRGKEVAEKRVAIDVAARAGINLLTFPIWSGIRSCLACWLAESEGAKFWVPVLTALRSH